MHPFLLGYFLVTGSLALVTLAFPHFVTYGLFLGILPGLLLFAAPPLFMYGAVTYLAWRASRPWGMSAAVVVTGVIVLAFAVVPPFILNWPTDSLVRQITAGDHGLAVPPPHIRRLALLRPKFGFARNEEETESNCGELCQRLLFNGAVDEMLLGPAVDFTAAPDPGTQLVRYRLERRASCPSVVVPQALAWPAEDQPVGPLLVVSRFLVVSDRIKARIAQGECLIEDRAVLKDADIVVVDSKAYESPPRGGETPWDLHIVSVQATRVSVFASNSAGADEVYRHTKYETERLLTPFLIDAFSSRGLNLKSGLVRVTQTIGTYRLRDVFKDVLKLDLREPSAIGTESIRDSLAAAIADTSLPADDPRLQLVDQYLNGLRQRGSSDPKDIELLRALIGDRRARQLFHLASAVMRIGEAAAPLAAPLLDRIAASTMPADRDIVQAMARAVKYLPAGAVLPAIDKLRTLAADKSRRGTSWNALIRLADGGTESIPLLLELSGTLETPHDAATPYDEADTPIGALIGLCLLGEAAHSAAPALLELLKRQLTPRKSVAGVNEQLVVTLEKIGSGPELEALSGITEEQTRRLASSAKRARRDPAARACHSIYS